ncbi:MAG: hypothetical protein ACLQUY_13585 [Ktedonobacterales bacterium]
MMDVQLMRHAVDDVEQSALPDVAVQMRPFVQGGEVLHWRR